jgi:DeoR family transcriptional regulator, aga operon transcriptional repressor
MIIYDLSGYIMQNGFISNTDRQIQILELIIRKQRVTTADIVEAFSISKATARRDLEALDAEGKIRRVHGGAILNIQPSAESPILKRSSEQTEEKIRIGQAAASLVKDGETVFLGSGTTVLEVARALKIRKNLAVITNSLPVVNVFAGEQSITVICLGGIMRQTELSFIGHITEQALQEVRADKVIIGTRAISLENGLTHDYLHETLTDRAILRAGLEVIVVADHTKFGRQATVLLAPLDQIHTIVTDNPLEANMKSAFLVKKIQVIEA